VVGALIDGDRIRIVPQIMTGSGQFRLSPFAAPRTACVPKALADGWLTDVVTASCTPIQAWMVSDRSEFVPILFALFALLRPRRYVELGVRDGMTFFAACQIAERLGLATECVAIDSWAGDAQAGNCDAGAFDRFRAYLAATYPEQFHIHAYFASALNCFDDGSIDLLHIDGLQAYEAVKQDFETWLPKLSDTGVVVIHGINEYGRDVGAWRLWAELRAQYPTHGFAHRQGLGMIFLGRTPHPFFAILRTIHEKPHYATLAQAYFKAIGALLVEQASGAAERDAENQRQIAQARGAAEADLAEMAARFAELQTRHGEMHAQVAELQTRHGEDLARLTELRTCNAECHAQLADLRRRHESIIYSETWRATAPVRAAFARMPGVSRLLRRSMKFAWWTLTGQMPGRYRRWRAAGGRAGQGA
jgi:hypothetical protein